MQEAVAAWRGSDRKAWQRSAEEESARRAARELARERRHQRLQIEKKEPVVLTMVDHERGMGILMPIFSLPAPHGIGTLGRPSMAYLDWLEAAGARYWQILPLNPTGLGDSPYASPSSWAGNPALIDLDALVEEELLDPEELSILDEAWTAASAEQGREDRIYYSALEEPRRALLKKAFDRARKAGWRADSAFQKENEHWLRDFALFSVIKETEGGVSWRQWPEPLKRRDPEAIQHFADQHEEMLLEVCWEQEIFYTQWNALKNAANERGILLIGDIPIYVAEDSADVWAHTEAFQLNAALESEAVAGVPPDFYNEEGQLWGNPLYDWNEMKKDGYMFWVARMAHSLRLYNVIRLDHFIGFARYWRIPAGAATAKEGSYVPGPGLDFFRTMEQKLGPLPILVEDLGVVEESVLRLRRQTGFPGMCPIEFAFGGEDSEYLPHNHVSRSSVYTSTHDSDTLRGWWEEVATPDEWEKMIDYFGLEAEEGMLWGILRGLAASVADFCIFAMQDVLMLGNEARLNRPGTVGGNWNWRLLTMDDAYAEAPRLHAMAVRFGRI